MGASGDEPVIEWDAADFGVPDELRDELNQYVAAARRGDPEGLMFLGEWSRRNDRPDQARAFWEKADAAGAVEAHMGLGYLDSAAKQYDSAIEHWRIATDKGSVRARYFLGRMLVGTRSDVAGGTELLKSAALAGDRDALITFGILQVRVGDMDMAAGAWYSAAQLNSQAGFLNILALFSRGDPFGAKYLTGLPQRDETLNQFMEGFEKGATQGLLGMAGLALFQERTDEARAILDILIDVHPENEDAQFLLGRRSDRPPFAKLFQDVSALDLDSSDEAINVYEVADGQI
jgi:TPR repeat protein